MPRKMSFLKIQDGDGGHLGFRNKAIMFKGIEIFGPNFIYVHLRTFLVEFCLEMWHFFKSKMAAAAILDFEMRP